MVVFETNDTTIVMNGFHWNTEETTILKAVCVGDEINTVAGDFKIVDVNYSDDEDDYEATCIWTVYKNDGTIYDVTKCIMTFGDLEDYIKYNYTDDITVKLIYGRE